jgi:hypothetical protein
MPPKMSPKQVFGLVSAGLITTLAASAAFTAPAEASCREYLGRSSTGQRITLDRCSINRITHRTVEFSYSLGHEQLYAEANCKRQSWKVQGVTHYSGSNATQKMIGIVCDPGSGSVVYSR